MAQEWTWLMYMAGDNGLRNGIGADLNEIGEGVTSTVTVAVHADRPGNSSSRVSFRKERSTVSQLATKLTMNGNTGDPRTLTSFIKWGKGNFSAPNYAVCIWGHAYGWLSATTNGNGDPVSPDLRNNRKALIAASRGLFKTTVAETFHQPQRLLGIAVDETSRDFLDTQELQRALERAHSKGEKYALLACDACYMGLLEIAFELRDEGEFFVASEEKEDTPGWDYTEVFKRFNPRLTPITAAKAVVAAYAPKTEKDPRATLSAVRLDRISNVADAVNALGAALYPLIGSKDGFMAIKRARADVHFFQLFHYVDLYHFAELLKHYLANDPAVVAAAGKVMRAVASAVIANTVGAEAGNAHGIAIYLPNEPVAPNYDGLALSRYATKWRDFVTEYGKNR